MKEISFNLNDSSLMAVAIISMTIIFVSAIKKL